MPFAATQMNQKTVILSEVSQTQKDKYHVTTYIWNLKEKKKKKSMDFPGGPVVKTLHSQCREHRFNP